jgi:hypothetical protein
MGISTAFRDRMGLELTGGKWWQAKKSKDRIAHMSTSSNKHKTAANMGWERQAR